MATMGEPEDDLQSKVQTMQERLERAKEDLIKTQAELTVTEAELKGMKQALQDRDTALVLALAQVRNTPYSYNCAYKEIFRDIQSPITYSSILYDSSNTLASIDTTGTFSSNHQGSYSVYWSLVSTNNHGDHSAQIYLGKNGHNIEESYHLSDYTSNTNSLYDQGGRSMIVKLTDDEDMLDLYCEDCSNEIRNIIFCVALNSSDTGVQ